MLSSKYFCLEWFGLAKIKMAVKATKTCVEMLIAKGISASEITAGTPAVVLTSAQLCSDKMDQACQVSEIDLTDSSLKTSFLNCLQDIVCTETEAKTVVSDLEAESLLTDKAACALQVIRSVNFDWNQCLINVLEDHLQETNSELKILDDNPVLFFAFKRKSYGKFRDSFQLYRPLLALLNINYYRWQVTWFWEYLINIPISENTYEYIYTMIDLWSNVV